MSYNCLVVATSSEEEYVPHKVQGKTFMELSPEEFLQQTDLRASQILDDVQRELFINRTYHRLQKQFVASKRGSTTSKHLGELVDAFLNKYASNRENTPSTLTQP